MIAGKVMMDRNAPEGLTDNPQRGYDESKALIARWSGRGRLDYAVTPRFAITSTEAQLEAAGALMREHPGVYMQTHLDENRAEIAFVKELFPWTQTYLEVYERYGLLGPRSVFGHCIHLEQSEVAALAASGSVAAFCPTSNLFLGSGLFDMRRLHDHRRAGFAGDRRRRRHQLFHAADRQRSLQSVANGRPVVARRAGLLSDDPRQCAGARAARPDRRDPRRDSRPT